MSDTTWSGPWCHAEQGGARQAWEPLTTRSRPTAAVLPAGAVYVVRWRVSGFVHPRKRTFRGAAAAGAAGEFARSIAAAALRGEPCDARGWQTGSGAVPAGRALAPARALDGVSGMSPPNGGGVSSDGGGARFPMRGLCAAGIYGNVLDEPERDGAGHDPKATTMNSTPGHLPVPTSAENTTLLTLVRTPPQPSATDQLPDGHTVASAVDALMDQYAAAWREVGQYDWWETQLRTVKSCFAYPDHDPQLTSHQVAAGSSIHLALLTHDDYAAALQTRRTNNNGAVHRNQQRRDKHARLMASYETKSAAWQARSGHRGRKPVPPGPPAFEREVADTADQTVVAVRTENAFRTAMSFVFDRAFTAGWMPPGPNGYRMWNPAGQGGRGRGGRSPFRRPEKAVVADRVYPTGGFFADLGDTLAGLGAAVGDGRHTGERYRAMPLTCWQLAPRPGEIEAARE